jgi:hypothetical protein
MHTAALPIGSGDTNNADSLNYTFGLASKVTGIVVAVQQAVTGGTAVITARRQITPLSTTSQITIGTVPVATTWTAGSVAYVDCNDWGDTDFNPGESILLEVTTLDSGAAGDVILGITFFEYPVRAITDAYTSASTKPISGGNGSLYVSAGSES